MRNGNGRRLMPPAQPPMASHSTAALMRGRLAAPRQRRSSRRALAAPGQCPQNRPQECASSRYHVNIETCGSTTCSKLVVQLQQLFNKLSIMAKAQVEDVWLATVMAVTRICHEPNGHLRNHAALVLTGYATSTAHHLTLHMHTSAFCP